MSAPWRRVDDRGGYLVLFAFLLFSLLAMAALVVDIGQMQAGATRNQSVADLSALAGGRGLGLGKPDRACQDAVRFLNANTPDIGAITADQLCNQPGQEMTSTFCHGGERTQVRPSVDAGPYRVEIRYPVSDGEIADPGYGSGLNDGLPCQRMTVVVGSSQTSTFAAVLGVDELSSERSATVRPAAGVITQVPALWLLDPTGCTSLDVSGGSTVTVGATSPEQITGIVTIDSDGSTCSSNQHTISATGTGSRIEAIPTSGEDAGVITSNAMPAGETYCVGVACDPADVSGGRVTPQPIYGERPTRAPVDWSYNCKTGYPDYHGVIVPDCPRADTDPAYVDALRSTIGTSGSPGASYQRWSTVHGCKPSGTIVASGNWWVDCSSGLSIGNGADVTFADGNVVLDGGLKMTGGSLRVNTQNTDPHLSPGCMRSVAVSPCIDQASQAAALVFDRGGSWDVQGGALELNHAALFIEKGNIRVSSGIPPIWLAPLEGPFSGLAVWAETPSNSYQISGGSGVEMFGTFFTPEAAPFTLTGSGSWGQQKAQFITFQLSVSGGAQVTMTPDPASVVFLPPTAGTLIR